MNPIQRKILQDLAKAALDATLAKELVEELLILLVQKGLLQSVEIKSIFQKLTKPTKP